MPAVTSSTVFSSADSGGHAPFWRLPGHLCCIATSDGDLVDVNPAWESVLGWSTDELAGSPFGVLMHPDDVAAETPVPWEDMVGDERAECRMRTSGGEYRCIAWAATFEDGRWYAIGTDVTEARAGVVSLRQAQEVATLASWTWDPRIDRVVIDAEPAAHFGAAPESLPTLAAALELVPASHRDDVEQAFYALRSGDRSLAMEYPLCVPGREPVWVETRAVAERDADGTTSLVRATTQDVTARRLAENEARLRARLLDEVDASVVAADLDQRVTSWNAGAGRLHGWRAEEAVGRSLGDLLIAPEARADVEAVFGTLVAEGRWEGHLRSLRKDGSRFDAYIRSAVLTDDAGDPTGFVGIAVDASERLRAERELRSARDYLAAVTDSIGEGVVTIDGDGRVVYANRAAHRLLAYPPGTLVGRTLSEVAADPQDEQSNGCALLDAIRAGATVHADDEDFTRFDGSRMPAEYTAAPVNTSDGARGSVIVFSDITARRAEQERLENELAARSWEARIRQALRDDRFILHAQPIIDLATGETVQHELLIRMLDDDGGLVPPGVFLPVAETSGLIRDIDRWVIREAARIAAAGHPLEVNLSAASLSDPELGPFVERELAAAHAGPSLLVFELTETALLGDEDSARAFIERVTALGCSIALDDFGTGYGGFTYLKRLPVQLLKIDIEFVRDLPRDKASGHVVGAVVDLARAFGQRTVAEGVEDDETLQLLKEYGVDLAQGYGIGRPAPVEQVFGPALPRRRARVS